MAVLTGDKSEIVFFDLETTWPEQGRVILEFGAILIDPMTLVERESFSTLVRPASPTLLSSLRDRHNGITRDALASAPTFEDIANTVYDLLHGRIWAGHNILGLDRDRIKAAFAEINMAAPEPKGVIDSLRLLRQRFGNRTDDMQTLAKHFGLGNQKHRSLEDVRMNIEVIKCCGAVLLLESSLPDNSWISTKTRDFLEPDNISLPDICVTADPDHFGFRKIQILHRNIPLKLYCQRLNITSEINKSGLPKLNFFVDTSRKLLEILETCESRASEQVRRSGSRSEWHPSIKNERLRLRLQIADDGNIGTEIYHRDSSGFSSRFDDTKRLESLFRPRNHVDAYISFDAYDYQRKKSAGIRLVAEVLIFHDF